MGSILSNPGAYNHKMLLRSAARGVRTLEEILGTLKHTDQVLLQVVRLVWMAHYLQGPFLPLEQLLKVVPSFLNVSSLSFQVAGPICLLPPFFEFRLLQLFRMMKPSITSWVMTRPMAAGTTGAEM